MSESQSDQCQIESELHASPHIHLWIGHIHICIYMDKTIWENALYVGWHEVLASNLIKNLTCKFFRLDIIKRIGSVVSAERG